MANRSTLSFSHISIGEGRDHISFIDRFTPRIQLPTAPIIVHAFRSNWSIVVCTFADCSIPLPASPPLPYFSWTEVQFHEEGRLLFYRIIRLQWVMIFISFPSILWMKYYNNYLVHLCITRSQVFWESKYSNFFIFHSKEEGYKVKQMFYLRIFLFSDKLFELREPPFFTSIFQHINLISLSLLN